MQIAAENWRKLFDAVYEMNSADSHSSFSEAVVRGLNQIVAAEVIVFQVLDRETPRIMTHMSPPAPFTDAEVAYYTTHSEEHPLADYYTRAGDPLARRISDVIELEQWRASHFYQTCLARLGLLHTLVLPVNIDAAIVVAVSFSRRDPNFTREDCEMMNAFAPHLRLAWNAHENPWADTRELESRRRLRAHGLSPRESEILFWMTEGKLNREIATILGLTLGTVQDNVARILTKLGAENRHAATVFAIGKLRH